jgi:hypothetical protein
VPDEGVVRLVVATSCGTAATKAREAMARIGIFWVRIDGLKRELDRRYSGLVALVGRLVHGAPARWKTDGLDCPGTQNTLRISMLPG